jgi:DUF1016 N-terminal domain
MSTAASSPQKLVALAGYTDICGGIVEIVNAVRVAAARDVNALMTASYCEIGRPILEAEQKGKRRAGNGVQLIARLSSDLGQQFGRVFSSRNLEQIRQFYLTCSIPQTLSAIYQNLLSPDAKLLKKELEKTKLLLESRGRQGTK